MYISIFHKKMMCYLGDYECYFFMNDESVKERLLFYLAGILEPSKCDSVDIVNSCSSKKLGNLKLKSIQHEDDWYYENEFTKDETGCRWLEVNLTSKTQFGEYRDRLDIWF